MMKKEYTPTTSIFPNQPITISRRNIKVKNLEKSVISKVASVEYKWYWAFLPEESGEIQYRESGNLPHLGIPLESLWTLLRDNGIR